MKAIAQTYNRNNIRAEVILSEIIGNMAELTLDDLVLSPDGGFNHSSRRDIASIHKMPFNSGDEKQIIRVARRGLFDHLPDGLFHRQSEKDSTSSKKGKTDRLLSEIKRKKVQEKDARKFFAPFDQLFIRFKMQIEGQERNFLLGFPSGARHTFYDIMWGDGNEYLSDYQKSTLFTLLPLAHIIAGDECLMAMTFHAILGSPVNILKNWTSHESLMDLKNQELGQNELGDDLIIGSSIESTEICFQINIGPVPYKRSEYYLPHRHGIKVLRLLENFFVPIDANRSYLINYITNPLQFLAEERSEDHVNRLGYSVNI